MTVGVHCSKRASLRTTAALAIERGELSCASLVVDVLALASTLRDEAVPSPTGGVRAQERISIAAARIP